MGGRDLDCVVTRVSSLCHLGEGLKRLGGPVLCSSSLYSSGHVSPTSIGLLIQ